MKLISICFLLIFCLSYLEGASIKISPPLKSEDIDGIQDRSDSTSELEEEVIIEQVNAGDEFSEPKNIRNDYLVLSGRQSKFFTVSLFITISTTGDITRVSGVFIQERDNIGVELFGKKSGEGITLYEITRQNDNKVTTNNTWLLTERKEGKWKMSSLRGIINLQELASPVRKKFKFLGQDIHPQVVGLLFEKVNGFPIAVNVRNFRGRSVIKKGEWRQANLEYGYVHYRVLTHWGHSWILETIRSGEINSKVRREIIHVIWVKDHLTLFKLIEKDNLANNRSQIVGDIKVVPVDNNSPDFDISFVKYSKRVNGVGLAKYFPFIDSSLPLIEPEEKQVRCGTCNYGILHLTYDVVHDFRVVGMDLVASDKKINQDNVTVNEFEFKFDKTLQQYLDADITRLDEKSIYSFINTWLGK